MNLPLRERSRPRLGTVGVLLSACLLLVAVQSAAAQRVQIDFDEFHGHDGTVDYIRDVARAYPNISELLEIGQSTMGRPIYVLVISNMSTGTTIDQYVELRNPRREGVDNVTPMKSYRDRNFLSPLPSMRVWQEAVEVSGEGYVRFWRRSMCQEVWMSGWKVVI